MQGSGLAAARAGVMSWWSAPVDPLCGGVARCAGRPVSASLPGLFRAHAARLVICAQLDWMIPGVGRVVAERDSERASEKSILCELMVGMRHPFVVCVCRELSRKPNVSSSHQRSCHRPFPLPLAMDSAVQPSNPPWRATRSTAPPRCGSPPPTEPVAVV